MKSILYVALFIISFLFFGCFTTLVATQIAVSTVSTSQEVEEVYDGDIIEYTKDKFDTLYEYINKKIDELQ
jgi:hypothetical protein